MSNLHQTTVEPQAAISISERRRFRTDRAELIVAGIGIENLINSAVFHLHDDQRALDEIKRRSAAFGAFLIDVIRKAQEPEQIA